VLDNHLVFIQSSALGITRDPINTGLETLRGRNGRVEMCRVRSIPDEFHRRKKEERRREEPSILLLDPFRRENEGTLLSLLWRSNGVDKEHHDWPT
jgi:hypothetical protein